MINIAVLGYGVVGSGVVELLNKNSERISERAGDRIAVKRILDIRDFSDSPYSSLFTKDCNDIFNDDSISIVVETIGILNIAYEYTKRALETGKSVVTSNKELVATYGPELLKLAYGNRVHYLFEASVGGGIPIIRPLEQCLAANEINSITGILNGTTNYILTQMKKEGKEFADALKEAQQKGYAEANPTADIEGHDTCRKIAILSSIAYNRFVDSRNIHTEGISNISAADIEYAEAIGSSIKLLAVSRRTEEGVYIRVSPALISKHHPLANVEDVFNAILVNGDAVGDAMFYGRGAGKLPTASAVVADIIDIVRQADFRVRHLWEREEGNNVIDVSENAAQLFVRASFLGSRTAGEEIKKIFGDIKTVTLKKYEDSEIAFITDIMKERELAAGFEKLKKTGIIKDIINMIRIEG